MPLFEDFRGLAEAGARLALARCQITPTANQYGHQAILESLRRHATDFYDLAAVVYEHSRSSDRLDESFPNSADHLRRLADYLLDDGVEWKDVGRRIAAAEGYRIVAGVKDTKSVLGKEPASGNLKELHRQTMTDIFDALTRSLDPRSATAHYARRLLTGGSDIATEATAGLGLAE